MIGCGEGLEMSAGPKGIAPLNPLGQEVRIQTPLPRKANELERVVLDDEPDAVLQLSNQAIVLCQRLMAEEMNEDERLDRVARELIADGYVIDSRKTAEAIMRRAVPELYQALVDAGEVEE